MCILYFYRLRVYQCREEGRARKESQQSCDDGVCIGQPNRQQQQFACRSSDVGNGWSYQSDDDERDEKSQELTEHIVECHKHAHPAFRQHVSYQYAQYDGDDNAG